MTDNFVIGQTEFGVERASLKVDFMLRPDGLVNAHIEVAGDEAVFEKLPEEEGWSWALYPPFFCLRQYPLTLQDAELLSPVSIADRDEAFEMNLYMMEHCEVSIVVIERIDGGISISGRVDMWGKDMPFRIRVEGI